MPINRDRVMISTAIALGQMEDDMLRRQERLDEVDNEIDDLYMQRITDEVDSQSPIYDRFLSEQGPESIMIMTNFSHVEFETLFTFVEPAIMAYWGVGRVHTTRFSSLSMFSNDTPNGICTPRSLG
jgi:hypothetical protein